MRFTLRDLLWLTMVIGLSLGWYLHYQRLTRPQKLYRDEEILNLMSHNSRYVVDDSVDPPELLIAPAGRSTTLSQVFSTLGIDPNRLTDFRYAHCNSSISLLWQVSPSYDLFCTTGSDDAALALDNPNRKIYSVSIVEHVMPREGEGVRSQ